MPEDPGWSARVPPPRGLVRPVPLDPSGADGPTRGQARGPRWRRSSHGRYVPAHVDADVPEQRVLEASALLPEGGAVTGWAALRWRGAGYLDGAAADGQTRLPVALAIGADGDLRRRPGVRLSRDRLEPADVERVRGLPCTIVERALFDEMRWAPDVREATVAMDMSAAAELTSIRRLRRYADARPGWRGLPQVHAALDLAAEDSRSPSETRMRLVWVLDAGLPRPVLNQPVFDLHGRLIGIPDVLDPVAGVVGEYDGAAHRLRQRHRRDVRREDLFRRVDLEYFTVVGADLADRPLVVDRMLATRSRARFLPAAARRWTLTPPAGWYTDPVDTLTLDERLEYYEWLREQRASTPG